MAQRGVMPEPKHIQARIKVVDPVNSLGRSANALILNYSDTYLCIRVTRNILVGSSVMVRAADLVMFGEVRSSEPIDGVFEIGVAVKRAP